MSRDDSIEKLNNMVSSTTNGSDATETTPLVNRSGLESNEEVSSRGISLKQAACLIAGELAGSGVLVLPKALTKTGWIGVPLIILACLMAAFSGKRLSDCWTILEGQNPELRTRSRNPYSIIAEQTLGTTWSALVSLALLVTQFGISVVYLLLAAQIVEQLFFTQLPTFTICMWYLIVVSAMIPVILFGTLNDFTFPGIVAFLSAVVACVLYFIELMSEIRPFVFRYGAHGFSDFFLAVGMILFAFGGACSFPTIQNDMAERSNFTKSLQYSFLATLALYLPIAIGGYSVLGESVGYNFATTLSATPLSLAGNIFMLAHLVSAFIIIIIPVCQEVEQLYDTPRDSLGRRTLVRLSLMGAILFIGETVPLFYTILALIGGSTIALLTYVLPSYCYLNLTKQTNDGRMQSPGWMRVVCWQVIAAGGIGGAFATFSAVAAMFGTSQAVPCYLR